MPIIPLSNPIPEKRQHSLALIVAFLLIVRSQLLPDMPKVLGVSLNSAPRLGPVELEAAKQEVYRKECDGSISLFVPFRGRIAKVRIDPTKESTFVKRANLFPIIRAVNINKKASIDTIFMKQLSSLLKLAFRNWRSKEVGLVVLHSTFLVFRTLLSVYVARLDGRIVRDLISADGSGFLRGLGWWFVLSVPSSYTNSMLRHLQMKLSLSLRTRLTRYAHDLYLTKAPYLRYYRIGLEGGLEGVDQYMTSDIAAFCDSLAALYGNTMKPSLDMVIFTVQIARSLGPLGSTLLWCNYLLTSTILRTVTPAFARMAAVEARLEGEYRRGVARAGREAEEIAFYDGGNTERDILWRTYSQLMSHVNTIAKIRIAYEWTEDFVLKYLWSAMGYCLISIPVLLRKHRHISVQAQGPLADGHPRPKDSIASRTEDYISNRRHLISIGDAGGRLMYAYKDLLELAGLTTRVYTLFSTLHALPAVKEFADSENSMRLDNVGVSIPERKVHGANIFEIDDKAHSYGLNDSLVEPLKLTIRKGEHLMITGPNGVGKTAIARVIAGLWETTGGILSRPSRGTKGVFVVPQRPYMVVGTLRDQIIYPHSYADFKEAGHTDEDLMEILTHAHLEYLPEREGGWTTQKEWRDVLSGGEKQRMGIARLFYHLPKFAVLDECTSAVSTDVEGLMYQHAKDVGITLITISHRPSLIKYHSRLLTLKGDASGSWTEQQVGTEEQNLSMDKEIASIEAKLAEVKEWEVRVNEIAAELGVSAKLPKLDKDVLPPL